MTVSDRRDVSIHPVVSGSPQVAAHPARGRRVSRSAKRQRRFGLACVIPLLLVNLLVIVGPAVGAVYYSLTNWAGLGDAKFIGLGNYRRLLSDGAFKSAMIHMLIWIGIAITFPVILALVGAFLLSRLKRGVTTLRLLFFVPYIVATVVSSAIWDALLAPHTGVTTLLSAVSWDGASKINWLGQSNTALPAVAFVSSWQYWGFLLILFFAAIQSVDLALYEAARIDGARAWDEFIHVTLPGMRPAFVFALVMTVIWSMLAFDFVFIMTSGGPAGASQLPSTLLYREAFTDRSAGYAASIGVTLALLTAVISLVYVQLRRRGWDI
jgi:raffinose/stachyose/melibiose transport system permease protein